MLTDLKILLQADSTVNLQHIFVKKCYIKCLARVPYDFLLITIPVSNYCLFSDINISQGSVVMHLRCDGIISYHYYKFITNSNSERILKIG